MKPSPPPLPTKKEEIISENCPSLSALGLQLSTHTAFATPPAPTPLAVLEGVEEPAVLELEESALRIHRQVLGPIPPEAKHGANLDPQAASTVG